MSWSKGCPEKSYFQNAAGSFLTRTKPDQELALKGVQKGEGRGGKNDMIIRGRWGGNPPKKMTSFMDSY